MKCTPTSRNLPFPQSAHPPQHGIKGLHTVPYRVKPGLCGGIPIVPPYSPEFPIAKYRKPSESPRSANRPPARYHPSQNPPASPQRPIKGLPAIVGNLWIT